MRGDFTPFTSKSFQIRDHFFALLLPKDCTSLKILDIQPWEVGAKKSLNGTSKMNTWTDKQTDKRKFRLIESIGPEGRGFENCFHGSKGTNKNTQKTLVLYNKVVVAVHLIVTYRTPLTSVQPFGEVNVSILPER